MAKKAKKALSLHQLRIITLRRASMRWKYKYVALNKAKVKIEIGKYKNGNVQFGTFFTCAECERKGIPHPYYSRKEVCVDHIDPIVDTEEGFTDWNDYVPNLLCESDNLQILCKKPCHSEKTARENVDRLKSKITKKQAKKA